MLVARAARWVFTKVVSWSPRVQAGASREILCQRITFTYPEAMRTNNPKFDRKFERRLREKVLDHLIAAGHTFPLQGTIRIAAFEAAKNEGRWKIGKDRYDVGDLEVLEQRPCRIIFRSFYLEGDSTPFSFDEPLNLDYIEERITPRSPSF